MKKRTHKLRRATALSLALFGLFVRTPATAHLTPPETSLPYDAATHSALSAPGTAAWNATRRNGRVAFDSNRDGNFEIYTSDADGSGLERLTTNTGDDFLPVWSPDGRALAFLSTRDGNAELYLMNADGSGQRRLTNSPGVDEYPTWSPDGSKIAFLSNRDGNYEIYSMGADGGNVTRLTNHPGDDLAPSWSPDGARITFGSEREGNPDVYVMGADGSNQTKLAGGAGIDELPDWQPLAAPPPGPVDDSSFFVAQHYRDFLNREPDAEGLRFWVNVIEQCGSDFQCREAMRVNVSAAFFLSIEFQNTGYLVYRMYKASFGDLEGKPVAVNRSAFMPDTMAIGNGVVVGQGDWRGQLENNKNAFALAFVGREAFQSAYPSTLTAGQFVTQLNANSGGVLDGAVREQLASIFGGPAASADDAPKRAQVLRAVAENAELQRREFNRAFVLMQYFGYLRRNPDDAPDSDFRGWRFWLDKLDQFNGNYVEAEMVKAFISSDEYRKRFGQ